MLRSDKVVSVDIKNSQVFSYETVEEKRLFKVTRQINWRNHKKMKWWWPKTLAKYWLDKKTTVSKATSQLVQLKFWKIFHYNMEDVGRFNAHTEKLPCELFLLKSPTLKARGRGIQAGNNKHVCWWVMVCFTLVMEITEVHRTGLPTGHAD